MRRTRTETREVEVVEAIVCNLCEGTCGDDALQGYVTGGYGSPLGDMNAYQFDVCGRCLKAWFATFAIDPRVRA